MASGKSVQLYLVDGTPGGLMIAEIVNWTGKILSCPRSNLDSLLRRTELEGTGVYILIGDDPEIPTKPTVYIGETDEVKKRLIQHNKYKDFWNRVITITNKDLNMTKAHVRYLENRIITKVRAASRATLENGNDASAVMLPEASQSDMEQFLEHIELILPLLNVNILRKPVTKTNPAPDITTPPIPSTDNVVFKFHNPKRGLNATAQEVDGEFVVVEGSEAIKGFSLTSDSYSKLKEVLEKDGTLSPTTDPNVLQFSRDYSFASPSAAGAIVSGSAINGRRSWRVESTGQTYGAWQQEKVDAVAGS